MSKDPDEEFRPNRSVCDDWAFNNDKPFTENELGEIRVYLQNWSSTNKSPCEFNSTTNGFQITIHHFCADGRVSARHSLEIWRTSHFES
jgi:hypothetical protein